MWEIILQYQNIVLSQVSVQFTAPYKTLFQLKFIQFSLCCTKTYVMDSQCLPLNCQSQQLSSALLSACDFKSHFCKQCGPRSDCSFRSSLIWVHIVCLYAKIGLKSLQEYSADDINRRHFQMQVFLAF